MFGGGVTGSYFASKPAGPPPGAKPHPKANDEGKTVTVNYPTKASHPDTWNDKNATATFRPSGTIPDALHGVAMKPWANVPKTPEEWNKVPGQKASVDAAHPFEPHPTKHTGAGVMIIEPDGRIWLTKPTNGFGGYQHTFPKGTVEDGINLQASAIKEAYEETGLKVKIVGLLGDYERTTSKARYYIAQRVGGTPSDMGWESQALRLAPFKDAAKLLNHSIDKAILEGLSGEMSIGKSYEVTLRAAELLIRLKGAANA
jgi:ADP-ribose pyrophosphatase YjhB (NUDIX family)